MMNNKRVLVLLAPFILLHGLGKLLKVTALAALIGFLALSLSCTWTSNVMDADARVRDLEMDRPTATAWCENPPQAAAPLPRPVLVFPGWLDWPERHEKSLLVKTIRRRHPKSPVMVMDYCTRSSAQRCARTAIAQVPKDWLGDGVDVYAHSFGGLVAMEAYRQGLPVRQLVSTESPFSGSALAKCAWLVHLDSPAIEDMKPDSEQIRRIQNLPDYPRIVTIGKGSCFLMSRDSYESLGERHYRLSAGLITSPTAHHQMPNDPLVVRTVIRELEGAGP